MKKLLLSFLAIVMIVGFSANVMAQSTASANVATATLIIPISITNSVAMDFATVSASATAGTVVMTAASTAVLTPDGGATVISGDPYAGAFVVTGEGTQVFTITLPAAASTLTGSAAGTMTVDAWTCSEAVLNAAALVDGSNTFYVGGTLNIDANAVAGTYTGAYDIIVDYN